MTRGILSAWALVVSLVITVSCAVDAPMHLPVPERNSTTAAAEHADKPPVPAALRAAYIASVQRQAAEAYRVVPVASGLRAENALQRFVAEFAAAGARITPAVSREGEGFDLAATHWGCEGALVPVSPAEPEAEGNRVMYRREGLEEWFVNGPLGLEQGFRVYAPPACREAGGQGLVIALGGGSALRAEAWEQGGAVALRDGVGREVLQGTDLYVVDAEGRQLPAAFEAGGEGLSIRVNDRGAVYPIEVDPLWREQQKLTASDGAAGEYFGHAVALSEDTAIVGATGTMSNQGAAYVFVRSGSTWIQQQKLTASDGAADDHFGWSVALSGDTAIVGADIKMSRQGAAYVFVRSGSTWIQQQKLTASDGAAFDYFGWSVALSGDTAIVATYNKMLYHGAAYVFVRNGGIWTERQQLTASDGAEQDYFGWSVALSGDTAIVGANYKMSGQGAAYVFVRSGSTWIQQQKLTASDGAAGDGFGGSVALSGDTAIVGTDNGKKVAYVFVRSGSTWIQQQKLTASEGKGGFFGESVALSGDTAIVGASSNTSSQEDAAYVFVRSGSTWTVRQQLTVSDGAAGDVFGGSVTLNGGTAIVGTWYGDVAYAFIVPSPQGEPCASAAQCVSGACVDGVCCDTPCGGGDPHDCQACSKARGASADGTCTPLTDMICDDHDACSQNDICQRGTCTGIPKACKALDRCHDPGKCDPLTGTCGDGETTCSSLPPADQTLTVPANLQHCTTNDDCTDDPEGHTTCSIEGVCCDHRCEGKCMSCRILGSPGVCTPEHHVDFKADCGPQGYCLETCAEGECVAANGQTQCAAPECADISHVRERALCRARGDDQCPLSERHVFDCGQYACDQSRGGCLQQCASVKDCAPPYVCDHNHACIVAPALSVGSDPTCAFAPAPPARPGLPGVPGALALLALTALARRRARPYPSEMEPPRRT